jgi:hypothetical protein
MAKVVTRARLHWRLCKVKGVRNSLKFDHYLHPNDHHSMDIRTAMSQP